MKKLGIYIHIPFCLSKCKYCGFYSKPGSTECERKEYIEDILEDIREYGKTYNKDYIIDTVFIGGGTPSILDAGQIKAIMDELHRQFQFDENPEITIESNPRTLTPSKLAIYRESGINRLSIGLQSFDDKILETLGRNHKGEDFLHSYSLARQAGFDNINLDLMFAVPGHTMEVWKDTIKKAIEIKPEHISFYSLQIEEGTPFYKMYKDGVLDEVSEEIDREMYHYAIKEFKKAGYNHYEISNCSKPGRECRHNIKYWSMDEYIGIGSTASSYIEGCRFTEGPNPEFHQNTLFDNESEFVFTGLRKTSGISLKEFKEKYNEELWEAFKDVKPELEEFFLSGKLIEENGILRLSEEGIDISNKIMAAFV